MTSVRYFGRLLAVSAVILTATTGCTYVTQSTYEDKFRSLDEDKDGCTKGGGSKEEKAAGLEEGDCDDENEFECGLFPELPYDGWDNDCSGADQVDIDGDGYPGILYKDWIKDNPDDERRAEWPSDVKKDEIDCVDNPKDHPDAADINPGQQSDPSYDGVDSNCDGDNDFDFDKDGWMPDADTVLSEHPDKLTVQEAYEKYREDWGYDHLPKDGQYGDCRDTVSDEHPGRKAEDDVPYDGKDTNCDGNNDFDQDGDTFMPPADDTIEGRSETFGVAYDNFVNLYYRDEDPPWGEAKWDDCLDAIDTNLTGVQPETVYPAAPDTPYDGVHSDCNFAPDGTNVPDDADDLPDPIERNDYDVDGDGYRDANTNESAYTVYRDLRWPALFNTPFVATVAGDCDDTNDAIFPGTLEYLHDNVDQDCDGDADRTPFGWGGLTWYEPRRPVARATTAHYLLTTSTTDVYKNPTHNYDSGVTLRFDLASPGFDQPYINPPLYWQSPIPPARYPMGWGVDMVLNSSGDTAYSAGSYYRPSNNNTYLIVRELKHSSGDNYITDLAYDGIIFNATYNDVDIVRTPNNDYWVFACADDAIHTFVADAAQGWLKRSRAYLTTNVDPNIGGQTCFLDVPDPNSGTAEGTVCDETSCTTYVIDTSTSPINSDCAACFAEVTNGAWDSQTFDFADRRGDWLIGVNPSTGLLLHNFSNSNEYTMFPSTKVYAADMVMYDGDMYIGAVLDDGSSGRDVVLHHGDPDATMDTVTFDFAEPGVRTIEADYVSVHADANRVMLAASGPDSTNQVDPPQGAVGWVFLGQ